MKTYLATVYRQEVPTVTDGLIKQDNGNTAKAYKAHMRKLADVEGTHEQVWEQAKRITPAPVIDFHTVLGRLQ